MQIFILKPFSNVHLQDQVGEESLIILNLIIKKGQIDYVGLGMYREWNKIEFR